MSKAEDLGQYFRIPADLRDLNYTDYVQTGGPALSDEEYNSNNTRLLNVAEMKSLLLTLDYVQRELELWRRT
jgi:UDP-glucose 4-epimerase